MSLIPFPDRSDLSQTLESGSNDIRVSGVMQKAVIEVNEKSTEAAAVSAITISSRWEQFYMEEGGDGAA